MTASIAEQTAALIEPRHPSFCEGGIQCEAPKAVPADWSHEGRETTWHAGDTRLTLKLVRHDSQSRGGEYHRGRPEVELTVTDTSCLTSEGDEITVSVELDHGRLNLLLEFLREYQREAILADDITSETPGVYDMPTSELPKRHGATKAQQLWNAIDLGRSLNDRSTTTE